MPSRRQGGAPVAMALFRLADYRYMLIGSIMVSAGYNLRQMAQAWLVLDLTNSPLKAGIVNAMPGLVIFTSLYGGAVLDRTDRWAVLVWSRVALALLILITAVLVATGVVEWWYLVIIGFGLAIAFTFHDTANQSFAMDVVGRDRLVQAVSISSIISNVAGAVTPVIGGALIAFGIHWAFWLLTGIYILSFVVVIPVRTRTLSSKTEHGVISDMKAGLKYARSSPEIRWLLGLSTVFLFYGIGSAIVPIFARDVFDVGAVGYGWLATAMGLGSLCGAIALTIAGDFKRTGLVIFATLMSAASAMLLLALTPWFMLGLMAMFVLGAAQAGTFITIPTTLQRYSAQEMRSRVVGLFFMVVTLMMIGWVGGGALVSVLDARQTAVVAAAGTCTVTLVAYVRSKTLRDLA